MWENRADSDYNYLYSIQWQEELGRSGVSFYVGNLHKWGFAPRPCAFLWARQDLREGILPLVTNNTHRRGFRNDFMRQVGYLDGGMRIRV